MQKNKFSTGKEKSSNTKLFYSLTGVLSLLVLIGVFIYINYMNYWPFNNDKISGLPDQHIRAVAGHHSSADTLLFDQTGAYEMNYLGSGVNFYAEHYHFDESVERIEFGTLSQLEDQIETGHFTWGITNLKTTNSDAEGSLGNLFARLELSASALSFDDSLTSIPKFEDGLATSSFLTEEPVKIEKNQPIPLLGWAANSGYADYESSMSPEIMAEREDYVVLYLEFN